MASKGGDLAATVYDYLLLFNVGVEVGTENYRETHEVIVLLTIRCLATSSCYKLEFIIKDNLTKMLQLSNPDLPNKS